MLRRREQAQQNGVVAAYSARPAVAPREARSRRRNAKARQRQVKAQASQVSGVRQVVAYEARDGSVAGRAQAVGSRQRQANPGVRRKRATQRICRRVCQVAASQAATVVYVASCRRVARARLGVAVNARCCRRCSVIVPRHVIVLLPSGMLEGREYGEVSTLH